MSPDTVEFASCKPAGILSGASCSAYGKATHAAGAHFCHIVLRRSPCLGLKSPPVRDVRDDADAEGFRAVLPERSISGGNLGRDRWGSVPLLAQCRLHLSISAHAQQAELLPPYNAQEITSNRSHSQVEP